MKRIGIIFLAAVFLISINGCSSKEKKVTTTEKIEKSNQVIDAYGTVKAKNEKNINIDFPAFVSKVHVREGYRVKSGDAIMSLDTYELDCQIEKKEHELNTAKYELEKVEHELSNIDKLNIEKINNQLEGSKAELDRLKSELDIKKDYLSNSSDPDIKKELNNLQNAEELYRKALGEYEDKERLFKAGVISQHELDEFKKTVDAKKKDVDNTKDIIASLQYNMQKTIDRLQSEIDIKFAEHKNSRVDIDKTQLSKFNNVKIKKEQVASLESDLKLLKDKRNKGWLKGNDIIAEVQNGVVHNIGYQEGDAVSNEKKAVSIIDLDSLIIEADVAEEFIKDVKIGAPVVIIPTADKSKKYEGKIIRIFGKAVEKDGETNIPVEISIDNNDGFIMPDYNVDIKISMEF